MRNGYGIDPSYKSQLLHQKRIAQHKLQLDLQCATAPIEHERSELNYSQLEQYNFPIQHMHAVHHYNNPGTDRLNDFRADYNASLAAQLGWDN